MIRRKTSTHSLSPCARVVIAASLMFLLLLLPVNIFSAARLGSRTWAKGA